MPEIAGPEKPSRWRARPFRRREKWLPSQKMSFPSASLPSLCPRRHRPFAALPSRTRPRPSHRTKGKLLGDSSRGDPVRGCRDWVRGRCKCVLGARNRVAGRRDGRFGARIPPRGEPRSAKPLAQRSRAFAPPRGTGHSPPTTTRLNLATSRLHARPTRWQLGRTRTPRWCAAPLPHCPVRLCLCPQERTLTPRRRRRLPVATRDSREPTPRSDG